VNTSDHHIHRIYISRYLTCQSNSSEGEATDHWQKGARWRTARVIISLILPNQSQWSSFAVIGYAKADHQRPSNVKVIFQRPSCGYSYSWGMCVLRRMACHTLTSCSTSCKFLSRPFRLPVSRRWYCFHLSDTQHDLLSTADKRSTPRHRVFIISLILPNQSQWSSFAVIGYAKAGHQRSPVTCRLL